MRENFLTPIAQGNLQRHHQSWETWNSRTTTHEQGFSAFQFFQKKLGMSATDATFSILTFESNVRIWRMFMTSSTKAAIHLGPNYLSNSEIYKNTNSRRLRVCSTLVKCWLLNVLNNFLNVKCRECSSHSWTRSVLANDQVIKWAKAKVCVYADSVLCVGQMKDTPEAVERRKGPVEGLRLYSSYQDAVGIDGEAIEFEWKNSQDFHHCSARNPRRLGDTENPARGVHRSDYLHVNAQWHCVKHEWWDWCFECRKSQELCKEILKKDIGHSWVQARKRSGVEVLTTHKKGQWNSTADNMIQRFKETVHPVLKSVSALRHKILKQKEGKTSIHVNGDSRNTELLFQTVHSVNQLSVYGAVADWCYQFDLTEREKGWTSILVDNKIFVRVENWRSTTLGASSDTSIWKQDSRKLVGASKRWPVKYSWHNFEKKLTSNILWLGSRTKFDQIETTDGEQLLFCAENIRFLDTVRKPKLWQLFLKAQLLDQFWKFILWKFLTDME